MYLLLPTGLNIVKIHGTTYIADMNGGVEVPDGVGNFLQTQGFTLTIKPSTIHNYDHNHRSKHNTWVKNAKVKKALFIAGRTPVGNIEVQPSLKETHPAPPNTVIMPRNNGSTIQAAKPLFGQPVDSHTRNK